MDNQQTASQEPVASLAYIEVTPMGIDHGLTADAYKLPIGIYRLYATPPKADAVSPAPVQAVQLSGDGWMPIEAAPKDGTTVLLAEGDYVDCGFWHDGSECYGHRGGAGWFSENDRPNLLTASNIHPTHWRAFPPPPAGTARGGGL